MVKAQQLGDLRAKRDDLERRVHDLKLTRQVTMQSLPSIRIVQQNDKALVGKIASTMANTIPLWRQQLAMALTIARSADAGETLKKAAGFDCASRLTPGAPTKASRAEHYAASFRVAGPGKDTSVALLWAKEDGYWKIVSWSVSAEAR